MAREERGPGNAVAVTGVDKFAKEVVLPRRGTFDRILPDTVDTDAFVGLTIAALSKAPKTAAVAMRNPESLFIAMRECAALGLMPGTDEYALTVRDGAILGIVQYQGEIKRMFMFGTVLSVHADVICQGETLVRNDPNPPTHVVPGGWENRDKSVGNLIGAYAYAMLNSPAGPVCSRVVHMGREEIMKHRAMAGFYAIWDGDFGHNMWTKTAVHVLEKWVPKSSSFTREQHRAQLELSRAATPSASTLEYGHAPVSESVTRSDPAPTSPRQQERAPDNIEDAVIVEDPPAGDDPWATVNVVKQGEGGKK
jgi:recombination protein RecT